MKPDITSTLDTFARTKHHLDQRSSEEKTISKLPSPSRLGPMLVCFAFTPKPFPFENRRFFEIRHRLAFLMGVKELVENHGCLLPAHGFEKSVGNGVIDGELIDSSGNTTTLEATGSDRIKIQKIIQACLYRAGKAERVWVSSINERLECPPSIIHAINAKASELVAFKNQYPEIASRLYMPHPDVCPLCDNTLCPNWKSWQSRYRQQGGGNN
jgi:hypothetical protein